MQILPDDLNGLIQKRQNTIVSMPLICDAAKGTPAEWRDIPGYDGAYQISWQGEIRSYRYRGRLMERPRMLSTYVRLKNGKSRYVKLTSGDGKSKDVKVHKLVADIWLGGCPAGMVIYHKNGDQADNAVSNIGFITRAELGKKTGAKGRRRPVAKLQDGLVTEFYPSAREAGKKNYMSYQSVMDRCNGKVKNELALSGFTFRWDD